MIKEPLEILPGSNIGRGGMKRRKPCTHMINNHYKKTLEEFQKITRIITALSSSQEVDDIYSIILCALISPEGLNFSRSFLFTYDPKFDTFHGNMVLGPSSQEEACDFFSQMQKEESAINTIIEAHRKKTGPGEEDIWDFPLSGLKVSSLWISMVQKMGFQNPLTDTIRRLSYSGYGKRKNEKFFHQICKDHRPRIIRQKRNPHGFPPGLSGILDIPFLAIPVTGKTQPYALVLVDRKFSNLSITSEDLQNLEWFVNQASLSVENAMLYQDLQEAYNDLKQMEMLKSNFLSTVSHELRTPLTTIYGFVELLMDNRVGEVSRDQRELLYRVAMNTRHLINIVNDIIEVAEVRTHGMSTIKGKSVHPVPALKAAIAHVQDQREDKNISIDIQERDSVPPVLADRLSLERILYHLLDNAVKFSPRNGRVLVEFHQTEGELQIAITDRGIGIAPGHLRRIYDYFYQVDNKLSRSFEGLGLGLTVTRLLISATGGKILAESAPGKGSIFTIVYPIAKQKKNL